MDSDALNLLQKMLKDGSFSMTGPRRLVCELLWGQEPTSMRDLSAKSRGKIDRASLYRTVGLFERLGLVRRVYIGWKYKVELSDVFTHHHHHISCLGCGKVVAITEDQEIEKLISKAAQKHGFTPKSHQLEVAGFCSNCIPA